MNAMVDQSGNDDGLPGWLEVVRAGEVLREESLGWFGESRGVWELMVARGIGEESRTADGLVRCFQSVIRVMVMNAGNGSGDGGSNDELKELGLLGMFDRVVWVVGNVVSERGWFGSDRPERALVPGNNLGGWKINEGHVRAWRSRGGLPQEMPRWFRDVGHVGSGDQPVVYYRVFSGIDQFFGEWLERFVPKPGSVGSEHRYNKAGREFWSGGGSGREPNGWFRELCLAGYKGPVTQANPDRSVQAYWEIVRKIRVVVVQEMLNRQRAVGGLPRLKPDGKWGKQSQEVAAKFLKGIGGGKEHATEKSLSDSLRDGLSKELIESLLKVQSTVG